MFPFYPTKSVPLTSPGETNLKTYIYFFFSLEKYEIGARDFWELFYARNQNQFFKERNYLWISFPQLDAVAQSAAAEITFMEVGCGTGSTVIPILKRYPTFRFIAFDFSEVAVSLLQSNPDYAPSRCLSFVCDFSSEPIPEQFVPSSSVDIASMIFVLSALTPDKMEAALLKVFQKMKPGGYLLFRDYGVCDLAHVRFMAKGGRKLDECFYLRGDGTRAYFFSIEHISELLHTAGFIVKTAEYDTRELKNRKRKILMTRVWVHVCAQRPVDNGNVLQESKKED
jgi:SAM-dependent methyltransferase